jgi:hypothetical protein
VTKLVQPVEDPQFEALQDHVIGALDLPVRPRVCHCYRIHADMVIITKTEELFTGELRAIIGDDGVWDPEAMNYVGKK